MIVCNQSLPADERAWEASNGATRRNLVIINKLGVEIPANCPVQCRIGVLDKGNTSFIFINPGTDERVLGLFLNRSHGFVVQDSSLEVFAAASFGGPGNSESKMGVYLEGALIEEHSYKNRRPAALSILKNSGGEYVPEEELIADAEVTMV